MRPSVEALVERLQNAPTRTLALCKRLVNRSLESSREQAFVEEAMAQEQNMTTEDSREGVAAFLQRRPPEFLGR